MKDTIRDVTIKTFNVRLQDVITSLGVSKKEFAQAGGVTPQALSGYLNGSRRPDHETIAKWIRAFNINANYLLIYRGTMFRSAVENEHPMDLEAPGEEMNPPRAAVIGTTLGPVAERVDGIERASKGLALTDLLPYVIKILRTWYQEEAEKMPGDQALEPEGVRYAQETNQPNGPPRPAGDKHTRD
ncbi:helix-turn-helix domain-containing protein [Desulfovibrio caledoniensis]